MTRLDEQLSAFGFEVAAPDDLRLMNGGEESYLPEAHAFPDRGCFVSQSCRRCPLPKCLTELPLAVKLKAIELAGQPAERLLKDSLPPVRAE